MEYFLIKENEKEVFQYNKPTSSIIKKLLVSYEDNSEIQYTNADYFPDIFLSNNKWFISERFKEVISIFDPDIFLGLMVFINLEKQKQFVFRILEAYPRKAISSESQFNKDGTIKELVLEETKIKPFKIFKIKTEKEEFTIVSLEIAEKILRENIVGIDFIKIKTI